MTKAGSKGTAKPPLKKEIHFSCEKIANLFFRLNGCFLLENFLIQNETRADEGAGVEILSVRFPYRQELLLSGKPMPDHAIFNSDGQLEIILAEVKKGMCSINNSWFDLEKGNMERILYRVGAIPPGEVAGAVKRICADHSIENPSYRFSLFAIGGERNPDLSRNIIQFEWPEVLLFIHNRFLAYEENGSRQWDGTGVNLFHLAHLYHDKPDTFAREVVSKLDG
jgi:hypothetical protein